MKKEKPILFSTEMVKALMEGRKTMTRRIVKSPTGLFQVGSASYEPNAYGFYGNKQISVLDENERTVKTLTCPYGQIGDILWVRETWNNVECTCYDDICRHPKLAYKADQDWGNDFKWKPSIFMPKSACRIFLKITGISVERLHDIKEPWKEGVEPLLKYGDPVYRNYLDDKKPFFGDDGRLSFESLWRSINGIDSWELNPWVWCIEFKRIEHGTGK